MKRILLAVLFTLFTTPVFARDKGDPFNPPELTAEVAAKYAIYSMIASNSYHKTDRKKFPVEMLGWNQIDVNGIPTDLPTKMEKSGLAYDIFEKRNSNEVIFAFRGTDSKKDYREANFTVPPFNKQYRQAEKQFKAYFDTHKREKNITLTGHSLGGGLALSMSVRHGVDAVVFDSSPRVFDGLGDKHAPAMRTMIYEGGEILRIVRQLWKHKFLKIVPRQNTYRATFDFGGADDMSKLAKAGLNHRSDYLALGLLKLGATVDDKLVPVLNALPRK